MNDEADDDLLQYMAWKVESPQHARAAWEAFYNRHFAFVFAALRKQFLGRSSLDEGLIRDLTVDVFAKVYAQCCESFSPTGGTKEMQSRCVRAWVMKIATNLVNDWFRANLDDEMSEVSLDHECLPQIPAREEASEVETPCNTSDVALMRRLLDSLSQRERDVLIKLAEKYDLKNGRRRRLSESEVNELAKAMNTTPENVRQIRRRALKWLAEEFTKAKAEQKLAG